MKLFALAICVAVLLLLHTACAEKITPQFVAVYTLNALSRSYENQEADRIRAFSTAVASIRGNGGEVCLCAPGENKEKVQYLLSHQPPDEKPIFDGENTIFDMQKYRKTDFSFQMQFCFDILKKEGVDENQILLVRAVADPKPVGSMPWIVATGPEKLEANIRQALRLGAPPLPSRASKPALSHASADRLPISPSLPANRFPPSPSVPERPANRPLPASIPANRLPPPPLVSGRPTTRTPLPPVAARPGAASDASRSSSNPNPSSKFVVMFTATAANTVQGIAASAKTMSTMATNINKKGGVLYLCAPEESFQSLLKGWPLVGRTTFSQSNGFFADAFRETNNDNYSPRESTTNYYPRVKRCIYLATQKENVPKSSVVLVQDRAEPLFTRPAGDPSQKVMQLPLDELSGGFALEIANKAKEK